MFDDVRSLRCITRSLQIKTLGKHILDLICNITILIRTRKIQTAIYQCHKFSLPWEIELKIHFLFVCLLLERILGQNLCNK